MRYMICQSTIRDHVQAVGIGLHFGEMNELHILPADENTGIVFHAMEDWTCAALIRATIENAADLPLRTSICGGGMTIGTIEHIMSALHAHGVDNAVIKLWGREVPILDGSAAGWSSMIASAGKVVQQCPRKYARILREIRVEKHDAWCSISPSNGRSLSLTYEMCYDHPLIGDQSMTVDLSCDLFEKHLAASRTFGFIDHAEAIRKAGLARGAGPDNTVIFTKDGLMPGVELRWPDEPLRHKITDAIGDLYLFGHQIIGDFIGHKSGHSVNQMLVSAMVASPDAWEYQTLGA